MATARYRTKPLESLGRARELTKEYWGSILKARDEGSPIIWSEVSTPLPFFAAFPDHAYILGTVHSNNVARNDELCAAANEAADTRGLARDMCGLMRNDFGAALAGRFYGGGDYPKPSLVLAQTVCEWTGRSARKVAEFFGVPSLEWMLPLAPYGQGMGDKEKFLANQYSEVLSFMERALGREVDEECLVEGVRNLALVWKMWAEITDFSKFVPAPVDMLDFLRMQAIPLMVAHKKSSVDFLREVKAELQSRVDERIAAEPNERLRLLHVGIPPWGFLQLFRDSQRNYGVVWLAIWGYASSFGSWMPDANGDLVPGRTPEEQGLPLRNRDDAVRALARMFAELRGAITLNFPDPNCDDLLKAVKRWKANGAMFHDNHGCRGLQVAMPLDRWKLEQAGIPVGRYESNSYDRKEMDEGEVNDAFDRFFEMQGIKQITKPDQ